MTQTDRRSDTTITRVSVLNLTKEAIHNQEQVKSPKSELKYTVHFHKFENFSLIQTTHVDQISIIASTQVMQHWSLIKISQIAHIFTFLEFGRIDLLNLVFFQHPFFVFLDFDRDFVTFRRIDDAFDVSSFFFLWNPTWPFWIIRLKSNHKIWNEVENFGLSRKNWFKRQC